MYEHIHEPLAPKPVFYRRVIKHLFWVSSLIIVCLIIGILGYYYTTNMSWIDALHNAAMILGGMGLVDVDKVTTTGAKLFSSFYALFSGVIFITNIGLLLAPLAHRLIHRLHVDGK